MTTNYSYGNQTYMDCLQYNKNSLAVFKIKWSLCNIKEEKKKIFIVMKVTLSASIFPMNSYGLFFIACILWGSHCMMTNGWHRKSFSMEFRVSFKSWDHLNSATSVIKFLKKKNHHSKNRTNQKKTPFILL